MQTFINNQNAFLKAWPKSLQEWDAPEPEIKFTIPGNRIVHPGDRILAVTTMRTGGLNSDSMINVFYIIKAIKEVKKNAVHITDTDITATAKRFES